MTAWLADALGQAGLDVRPWPGWQGRGGPGLVPRGVVIHHTAGSARGDAPSLPTVVNGRRTPPLPGPLYNVLVSRQGLVHVVAGGVANHAGPGGWRGLRGNTSTWAVAAENTGRGEPYPEPQMRAWVAVCAVLCRRSNIPTDMVCGHLEWAPGRKIDPQGVDLGRFRSQVFAALTEMSATVEVPMSSSDQVSRAQAVLNSWLEPSRRVPVDGAWGQRSTDALVHVLDVVAKGEIARLAGERDEAQAEAARAVAAGPMSPRLVALAGIGDETARWVQNVSAELAKLDRLPE